MSGEFLVVFSSRVPSRIALGLLLVAGSAAAAHAHTAFFTAKLTGPAESPSNTSLATGTAFVTLDLDLVTMRVQIAFQGLTGTTTAAHIHAPTAVPLSGTAGVATQTPSFEGFPLGVTSGTYDHTFDLALASTYNPDFITSSGGLISDALNALDFALDDGKAYLNIHTTAFPGGEIRGFLVEAPSVSAPEPASIVLMGLGATALIVRRRRRPRSPA
jgi:hypothetical protein